MQSDLDIDVVIEDSRWQAAVPDASEQAERAVRAAFSEVGFDESATLCVLLADDDHVQSLNNAYRGKDQPTNVLSFPTEDAPTIPGFPRVLGDVVLAFDTVQRESDTFERSIVNHFLHLIVHASLHLIGYTHEAEQEADRMEAFEISVLAKLGVPDPYADAGQSR
ncbi:UNVERIFIED_CONTAM: hypothetical protein GTU68_006105 [Idotea baltica]|nr:hypothetical protein [Idotea baltica]